MRNYQLELSHRRLKIFNLTSATFKSNFKNYSKSTYAASEHNLYTHTHTHTPKHHLLTHVIQINFPKLTRANQTAIA